MVFPNARRDCIWRFNLDIFGHNVHNTRSDCDRLLNNWVAISPYGTGEICHASGFSWCITNLLLKQVVTNKTLAKRGGGLKVPPPRFARKAAYFLNFF